MLTFRQIWQIGQFFMLVIPSILVGVGMALVGTRKREGWERRRLLFLIVSTTISLGLLDLLILTNPYGREISSSLTAIGMLPVTVALLVAIFNQPQELKRLWPGDKSLVLAMSAISLVLLGVLWWLEARSLYVVAIPTAVMALVLVLTRKISMGWLIILSLIVAGLTLWLGGGSFSVPALDAPTWQVNLRGITLLVSILLTIFLPAAYLYAGLRGDEPVNRRMFAWYLALSAVLLACSAYQVYWEGIWSAAHARAYEDHLPFNQIMVGLMAGLLLVLLLRGRRRWAGALYTLTVTALCVAALSAGWRVSAFTLTEKRAAQVELALQAYREAHGSYPAELGELTPRYMLLLPPPVIVRQNSWCYQGGEDAYRLGFVSGDFTYFEAHFRADVFSQAGNEATVGSWNCDEMVARLEQGGINY